MKRGSRFNHVLDFYAGIPLLSLISIFRRKRAFPAEVKRIGVLVNPALGDTLICSGPILDVRQAYPDAKIVLFATASNDPAARLLPAVDHIEIISLTDPFNAIRKLRRFKLDLLVDFTSWQRISAGISACSGAGFVVGYSTGRQYRHFGYDKAVEHRADRHELENHRALASSIGATARSNPRVQVYCDRGSSLQKSAAEIIVLHAWPSGSGSWLREWPESRWVELAKSLEKPGRVFVISGSPKDKPRSQVLSSLLQEQGLESEVFVGTDGLESLAMLLSQARLLISVNTGIMHLGWIMGTPTISINGPTAQHRWGPLGSHTVGVNTPDGSGGFLHLGFEFKGQPTNTMERISTQQVLEKVEQMLAS